jgi:Arc/MetJ-type ribon-helix-helix transcriptional regulator
MRTVQITLSAAEAAFIEAEIAAGRGQDAEDVLHGALELAIRDLDDEDWKHWELQRAIAEADEEVERGDVIETSARDIMDEIIASERAKAE